MSDVLNSIAFNEWALEQRDLGDVIVGLKGMKSTAMTKGDTPREDEMVNIGWGNPNTGEAFWLIYYDEDMLETAYSHPDGIPDGTPDFLHGAGCGGACDYGCRVDGLELAEMLIVKEAV